VQLRTEGLLVPDDLEGAAPAPQELGWPEVRSGLHRILLGYLVTVAAFALLVLGILYIATLVMDGRIAEAFIDAGMLVFFGAGLMVVLGILSVALVVTGKVRCLLSVPERSGAKWLMFCSILCFVVSPALNIASDFIPSKVTPDQVEALMRKHSALFDGKLAMLNAGGGKGKSDPAMTVLNEVRDLIVSVALLDSKAYITLAGMVAGLLHTMFFVLFLRAVAQCFGDTGRRLFAECYLLFSVVLVGSCVYLFFHPPRRVADLGLMLLILAGGMVLNLLWYLALIVSASMGIARGMALRRLEELFAHS
jgi:hypothetical protein